MECPNCERYKRSASIWRNEAYKLSGHPLPWKPEWQGLTIEELQQISDSMATWNNHWLVDYYYAIESKLREKNYDPRRYKDLCDND